MNIAHFGGLTRSEGVCPHTDKEEKQVASGPFRSLSADKVMNTAFAQSFPFIKIKRVCRHAIQKRTQKNHLRICERSGQIRFSKELGQNGINGNL